MIHGAPGTPITVNFPESDIFAMQSNLHDVYGYLNTTNLVNKALGRGGFLFPFFLMRWDFFWGVWGLRFLWFWGCFCELLKKYEVTPTKFVVMVSVPSNCQQLREQVWEVMMRVGTLTGKSDTTQSMIYYDWLSFVVIAVISVSI